MLDSFVLETTGLSDAHGSEAFEDLKTHCSVNLYFPVIEKVLQEMRECFEERKGLIWS